MGNVRSIRTQKRQGTCPCAMPQSTRMKYLRLTESGIVEHYGSRLTFNGDRLVWSSPGELRGRSVDCRGRAASCPGRVLPTIAARLRLVGAQSTSATMVTRPGPPPLATASLHRNRWAAPLRINVPWPTTPNVLSLIATGSHLDVMRVPLLGNSRPSKRLRLRDALSRMGPDTVTRTSTMSTTRGSTRPIRWPPTPIRNRGRDRRSPCRHTACNRPYRKAAPTPPGPVGPTRVCHAAIPHCLTATLAPCRSFTANVL